MSRARPLIVHCWTTTRDALCDEYEAIHGPNTFVGSLVWRATFAPGWREGICMQPMEHLGDHIFEDEAREERKAS